MRKSSQVLFICFAFIFFLGCQQQSDSQQVLSLQHQVDSLQEKLDHVYTPGLGDLMGRIHVFHNKLWFAGSAENWPLAKFSIVEIEEILEDVMTFHAEKPETKLLPMIEPALSAMQEIIDAEDTANFKKGYLTLSNTCNACHNATGFEFIQVTIPSTPALSNQVFLR